MVTTASNSTPVTGFRRLTQYSDVVLAMGVIMIVTMMIVPIPPALVDVLITLNIAGALTILLVSIYLLEPLQFSAFPSLLLLATLYRLGLNVTSTRLILLRGDAGDVIAAFGSFVVGGNYVVGIVVFVILVVIQFVVITNGAGRVAEVAARFTLDAMPGKQMAIDADLNAGLITEDEARARRQQIAREANFYGAMDGASKFVKGDAIAGVIIIIVNIIGGVIIGALQRGLPIGEALRTYALLTVGDGLVSQIPALLISTATGIIVTRASTSDHDLGHDMVRQVLKNPRALAIGGALLLLLGVIPGLPKLPFFLIAVALLGASQLVRQHHRAAPVEEAPAETPAEDDMMDLLRVDPMELEIGYGLIPLVDETQGGTLLKRITLVRRQVALDLGITVPTIRIRDNLQLRPNEYRIKLRGVEVAGGEVYPDRLMAMNAGGVSGEIDGIDGREPAFGLAAKWIPENQRMHAEALGYTVVDPASVVTTHLSEVIRTHAADILRRQDVQRLLDGVRLEHPAVVDELVPHLLSLAEVQQVLQHLLREGISIRDLVTVLEALGNHARTTKDVPTLAEHVRAALAPAISARYATPEGDLYVLTLQPEVSSHLVDSLQATESGPQLSLDPEWLQRFLTAIAREMERVASLGRQPILLVPAGIRLALRRATERSLPNLTILSYREIAPNVQVHAAGMVRV
ncbi:flagellar biosynthesis protein FlhA [Sphaerobacter sp.]|uniref:flagellar biosynthesis protein FlhA n=1 Tax=Sphaerobacter sp. TaxID=2099654 RepID=UPI001DD0D4F5|nr:flagellar biosynthesis protein FlhA [Sphaerobacter sp.]MBX5444665.1 flagellar biosynthesis protein FlhA [Sphaerobacter sp.]